MIRVGINGFGTIGKRVADAVALQDDMKIVGVVKTRPTFEAKLAQRKNYPIYTNVKENIPAFEAAGLKVYGTLENLLDNCDVIVDCTPGKVGAANKEKLYAPRKIKAIFQGGEKSGVAEMSFNASNNYVACVGKNFLRVVSCNTTGLCRTLGAIDRALGLQKVRATMIRRGADSGDSDTGPINAIVPNPPTIPSHHGADVNTILPKLDIVTGAFIVPTTLMHVHMVNAILSKNTTREEAISVLEKASRIILVNASDGIESTAQVMEYARDLGRPRGDLFEIAVWRESINVINGNELFYIQAVHQECNVVPENVDAIRAISGIEKDANKSIEKTNKSLNILI